MFQQASRPRSIPSTPSPYAYVLLWNIIIFACLYMYWNVYIGQYKLHDVDFIIQQHVIEASGCSHYERSNCYTASLTGTVWTIEHFQVNATVRIPILTGIYQQRSYIERYMVKKYKTNASIKIHTTTDYKLGVTDIDNEGVWPVIILIAFFSLCMTGDTVRSYRRTAR